MAKIMFLIIAIVISCMTIEHCQAGNDTSVTVNRTETLPPKPNKPFIYHGRYHRRIRRQSDPGYATPDTAATVLSILPLERIGTIVGQIMATGLKEMLNPDVGKKIVNVLENQAPLLLTSLFTNLVTNLRGPVRPPPANVTASSSVSMNNNAMKQLSNISIGEIMNDIRRPAP